jgi:2-(1,2-epoxy-1,2-dihydrophenyl)acetyl-CoA isomerase
MTPSSQEGPPIGQELREGVAIVTLNRPDSLNSVTLDLARSLADTLRAVAESEGVRAIMVTGEGRAFCSGGDIKAMLASLDHDPAAFFLDLTTSLHDVTRSLLHAKVPTVAAVNGAAVGFGFGLALSCDVVIAAERATFSMSHGRVAQIPDGGGWYLLPRVVGRKRALDLYFTCRVLEAKEAEDWGIVTEVLPTTNFREVAFNFTREIAQGPTLAYREAKRRLGESWVQPLEEFLDRQREVIAELGKTHDFAEGVRAFLDRRAPDFQGR